MFGMENVDAATKWLQGSKQRHIDIMYDNGFDVDFIDDANSVAQGSGEKLMDALKSALAGLSK